MEGGGGRVACREGGRIGVNELTGVIGVLNSPPITVGMGPNGVTELDAAIGVLVEGFDEDFTTVDRESAATLLDLGAATGVLVDGPTAGFGTDFSAALFSGLCLDLSLCRLCFSPDVFSDDFFCRFSSPECDFVRDDRVECEGGVSMTAADFDPDLVILVGGANWLKLMSSVLSYNNQAIYKPASTQPLRAHMIHRCGHLLHNNALITHGFSFLQSL